MIHHSKKTWDSLFPEVAHCMLCSGISAETLKATIDAIAAKPNEMDAVLEVLKYGAKNARRGMLKIAMGSDLVSDEVKTAWTSELNGGRYSGVRVLSNPKTRKGGFVYLMRNSRNGFIKIGWSRNPKHRESTLQSEEPEVHLIAKYKGTMEDEDSLHTRFSSRRKRGEWFELSNADISSVEAYFSRK